MQVLLFNVCLIRPSNFKLASTPKIIIWKVWLSNSCHCKFPYITCFDVVDLARMLFFDAKYSLTIDDPEQSWWAVYFDNLVSIIGNSLAGRHWNFDKDVFGIEIDDISGLHHLTERVHLQSYMWSILSVE